MGNAVGAEARWVGLAEAFAGAGLDGRGWLSALERLAAETGSRRAQLIGLGGPAAVPFNLANDVDEALMREFVEIGGGDPWVNFRIQAARGARPLQVIGEAEYDDARQIVGPSPYDDFAERADIPFGCQTILLEEDGIMIGMALLRGRRDGPTGAAHRRLFRQIAPHVRIAARTAMLLDGQGEQLVNGAMEALSAAAFVCDAAGQVRALTRRAEALAGPAGRLRLVRGRLRGRTEAENRVLAQAILTAGQGSSASGGAPRGSQVVLRDLSGELGGAVAEGPLVLTVSPLPSRVHGFSFQPRVLVAARGAAVAGAGEARETTEQVEALRALFDLTRSEAAIALAFVDGAPREAIARQRGVTVDTVRGQLKSVFRKVGVTREVELAARLGRLL